MPRKFYESFTHAWRGIRISFRTQRNLSIHVFVGLLAVTMGIYLNVSSIEMEIILVMIASVIVLELLNTAVEEIVNMLTLKRQIRAMVAKDVAAAAVLVASISAALVGLIIFVPKILGLLNK